MAIHPSEAAAYRESVQHDVAHMSRWLLEHVGQRITAVALGLSDASVVRQYAVGRTRPRDAREARLRLLYRIARTVAEAYDEETARAFLVGSNPQLGDRSPAVVIADEEPETSGGEVVGAARALVEG